MENIFDVDFKLTYLLPTEQSIRYYEVYLLKFHGQPEREVNYY
jgi:hypothetical protein